MEKKSQLVCGTTPALTLRTVSPVCVCVCGALFESLHVQQVQSTVLLTLPLLRLSLRHPFSVFLLCFHKSGNCFKDILRGICRVASSNCLHCENIQHTLSLFVQRCVCVTINYLAAWACLLACLPPAPRLALACIARHMQGNRHNKLCHTNLCQLYATCHMRPHATCESSIQSITHRPHTNQVTMIGSRECGNVLEIEGNSRVANLIPSQCRPFCSLLDCASITFRYPTISYRYIIAMIYRNVKKQKSKQIARNPIKPRLEANTPLAEVIYGNVCLNSNKRIKMNTHHGNSMSNYM